ncbi:DUF2225 domain-containing protein [Velocimicrobium porci]|uniref:DUF2225 domain-containing protein n=1 Tax=Velocimicrobium porci TaxID=2606634 RepID=A0A6L5XV14_9FIRM|nr:DUF2225 domain-containing protein [Velocimicrobium porci]MSS62552.1 DUF2225 domain-containing protein [Velocimicrobium porci]
MGIFSGLENFGLGKLKNTKLYEEEKGKEQEGKEKKAAVKHEVTEAELLFEKTYSCPVCYKEFKTKVMRTGKVKLLSADTDLRPKYQNVDSLKYEAIVCPHCGYAALNRFFEHIVSVQAKFIREQISSNFKGLEYKGDIYTYDDAIARYKLALLNTVVKKGKTSERAYTCLKLAWVIRGKAENLPKDTENYDAIIKELKEEEDELIKNAYEGFSSAFMKESFPICGMDELTLTYLIADLARRSKEFEAANRWVSQVITSRAANERIKNKAREIKELIKEDMECFERAEAKEDETK